MVQLKYLIVHALLFLFTRGFLAFVANDSLYYLFQVLLGLLGGLQDPFDEEPLVLRLRCSFYEQLEQLFDLIAVAGVRDQDQVYLVSLDLAAQDTPPKGFN